MFVPRSIALFLAAFAVAVSPICSFGAAQLRAGAKTSAQPTSTNPQLRQIQLTFDPDVTPGAGAVDNATYNVTSFQLSVKFDPTKVQVLSQNDVQLFGPFVPDSGPGATVAIPAIGVPTSNINNNSGLINFISGRAPLSQSSPGDVNIFTVTFNLLGTTTLDDLLTFTIFGDFAPQDNSGTLDFITGTDPLTGKTLTSFGRDIAPTTITSSFNGFAAQIAAAGGGAVPLPSGLSAGIVLLAAIVVVRVKRISTPLMQ